MPTKNFKWLLRKALYGLKQAPREWNEVLHKFLTGNGFTQSKRDPCIYGDRQILLRVYVDDILTTGKDTATVNAFRDSLKRKFKCWKGEELKWCLGMEINQREDGILLTQENYINVPTSKCTVY
jgi:hypothetical protein